MSSDDNKSESEQASGQREAGNGTGDEQSGQSAEGPPGQSGGPSDSPPQQTPTGGQPGSGSPAQSQGGTGQPGGMQGRAPGRRQPARQESVGDIFSKPSTQDQIKTQVAIFAAVGVGIGFAVFVYYNSISSGVGGFGAAISAASFGPSFAVAGPVLAGALGIYTTQRLADEEVDQLVFATVGVGAYVGHVALVLLSTMLAFVAVGASGGWGTTFGAALVGGIGAAIAGVVASYAVLNFDGSRVEQPAGTARGQQPQQQQYQQ